MSSQTSSDQDTIDRYNEPTVEHLISQNKMKDLALAKATNLIELLNIQMEVEKNSNQENIRHLEQEIRMKYETELARLREKIEVLQRQLQRTTASNSNQKTIRHSAFARANSLKSLESKKKRSVNKKYTQKERTLDSAEKNVQSELNIFSGVKNEYFKQKMLEIEEWKNDVSQQLDRLVSSEYEELGILINSIQAYSDDFSSMMNQKVQLPRNSISELTQIIRDQQHLIHNLRAYTLELEDLVKSSNYKWNSVLGRQYVAHDLKQLQLEQVLREIQQRVVRRRQEWKKQHSSLQDENAELRNILEGMIKLVREQKRVKN